MHRSWSKGFTKLTHPSVRQISLTMRRRKIDNFKIWREQMRRAGLIKSEYPDFPRNEMLAELIGVVLGDGHIQEFPRTERLMIFSNANNPGFVERYANIIETLFGKKPVCFKVKRANCIRISIYEKHISKRLGIPCGNRSKFDFVTPKWIARDRNVLLSFLRGLYEAEGCFSVHVPTCTYKAFFYNKNPALLHAVFSALQKMGFAPQLGRYRVAVSRRADFYLLKEWIKFRQYS